ncbi:hypothetical protein B0H63DRAFT_79909 [Podospora didyma]|uniref:Uncharacterized protein n=1 Tax=Podospora didyma TaxID=330526 RepID=A0AAE0N2P1_9PEZI|nr:hypothetical protein B0H63DRAFT_79909 [Podospora didyma]
MSAGAHSAAAGPVIFAPKQKPISTQTCQPPTPNTSNNSADAAAQEAEPAASRRRAASIRTGPRCSSATSATYSPASRPPSRTAAGVAAAAQSNICICGGSGMAGVDMGMLVVVVMTAVLDAAGGWDATTAAAEFRVKGNKMGTLLENAYFGSRRQEKERQGHKLAEAIDDADDDNKREREQPNDTRHSSWEWQKDLQNKLKIIFMNQNPLNICGVVYGGILHHF